MIIFVFIIFLIFMPMYMFTLFHRAFRIFRFVPYLTREVIVPQMKMATETEEEGEGGEEKNKIKLSSEQIRIIEDSVLTSSVEVNPKRFSRRTKKRLSAAFAVTGLVILALVTYQLFWFVYDYIVLTFF